MLWLARLLARLLGVLLLVGLAGAGVVAAVFCIQGGHGTLSLAGLASDLHLPELRHTVGAFLHRLEAHGPSAIVAALCGAGAILLGIILLAGSLVPRRERLIVLVDDEAGVVDAHRRALAQAAGALAEQPRSVLRAKARARPWRRGIGGSLRVRVRVDPPPDSADAEITSAVDAALAPLTGSLPLRAWVRAKAPRRPEARVQ